MWKKIPGLVETIFALINNNFTILCQQRKGRFNPVRGIPSVEDLHAEYLPCSASLYQHLNRGETRLSCSSEPDYLVATRGSHALTGLLGICRSVSPILHHNRKEESLCTNNMSYLVATSIGQAAVNLPGAYWRNRTHCDLQY